jgi:hypothetical protein
VPRLLKKQPCTRAALVPVAEAGGGLRQAFSASPVLADLIRDRMAGMILVVLTQSRLCVHAALCCLIRLRSILL